jgi:hypothetical protein
MITVLVAMEGLVTYAYNNLLADWYRTGRDEIPQSAPSNAPTEFLSAFRRDTAHEIMRTNAWELIQQAGKPWAQATASKGLKYSVNVE